MFNLRNILLCLVLGTASLAVANQLVQGDCPEDQFLLDGECIDRVFKPTNEFKKVLDGQQIPKNLHVKLDFSTGEKFAKLNVAEARDKTANGIILSQEKNFTQAIKPNADPVSVHKPGSKGKLQAPDQKVPAEENRVMQELLGYLDTLKSLKDVKSSEFLTKLEEIEDLVYRSQFGYDLTLNHNFPQLVKLMEETKDKGLKNQIAKIIGISVQNNPFAQLEASKYNLIDRTFKLIKSEKDAKSQSKLLFLLSSLVRNHEATIKLFHKLNGPQLLLEIYQSSQSSEVRKKCITLLTDSFNSNMVEEDDDISNAFVDQRSLEDKLWSRQSSGDVIDSWCQAIHSDLLAKNKLEFDEKEKLVTAVLELRELFPDYCTPNHKLISWLSDEHKHYANDEDFADYTQLVDKLKSKE